MRQEINAMVNAKVSFSGYKLSLFRAFPNASFTLKDLSVTGIDKFEGDTLAAVKSFSLVFNLRSLFGDGGYEIRSITIDQPLVNAIVLEDGMANWDIMKETPEGVGDRYRRRQLREEALQVALNKLSVSNGRVYYSDRAVGHGCRAGRAGFHPVRQHERLPEPVL
ncbi:MAG: AsmA family protein [Marinilabiliales bacterium]|nr:AsmA family protein [Marinilabiliales bacterium]